MNSRNRRKVIWLKNKVSTAGSYRSDMGEVGRIRIQYSHVDCSKEFSLTVR